MDVKSAFLNGIIKEEVYVKQPFGFEDYKNLNYVFKLNRALFGLKQDARVWYERLSKFLIKNKFKHEKVDTTLFIKKKNEDLLVVQICVDDIIFGATTHSLCEKFANLMKGEIEISMIGKLNFFLGLEIK